MTILGCGSEPGERRACRYAQTVLSEPVCKLETEFNLAPQKSPSMVIYEIDRFHGVDPTADQRRAAAKLVESSFEAAKKRGWYDIEQGAADGYRRLYGDRIHYANEEYIMDDRVLDPERPEYLMYYKTRTGKKLAGFMFLVRSPREEGVQIGGTLTQWHYHVWSQPICLKNGMMAVGMPTKDGCSAGEPSHRSPEMIHVWLVDHPRGPFASQMSMKESVIRDLFEKRGF
jgi:hypothetical protein